MNQERFDDVKKELLDLAESIQTAKRPAYTAGNLNVLHNFIDVARRAGISPFQAWSVYFNKHIDSINSYCKDQSIPQAEPLETRIADAICYLELFYGLYKEQLDDDSFNKKLIANINL